MSVISVHSATASRHSAAINIDAKRLIIVAQFFGFLLLLADDVVSLDISERIRTVRNLPHNHHLKEKKNVRRTLLLSVLLCSQLSRNNNNKNNNYVE